MTTSAPGSAVRPLDVLKAARLVLFAHAHPDDETLSTGALIAHLHEHDVECAVVTFTRGEQGDIVPGPLSSLAGTDALAPHRERELAGALAELGVRVQAFLGDPDRRYEDSGMQWVTPTVAGPADNVGPRALTSRPVAEAVDDVVSLIRHWRPDVLVTYDKAGGYGHPDHVRVREVCEIAARRCGVPLVEVLTGAALPSQEGPTDVLEARATLPIVQAALGCHSSQLTVDGDEVVHAGGQREPIVTTVGVRIVEVQ